MPRRNTPRNKAWARPLADFVGTTLQPVVARRSLATTTLLTHWPDIVGEHLSSSTRPIKMQWAPHGRAHDDRSQAASAVLHLRVCGATAIEVQHSADQIVARINGHLGWRCVDRLKLHQGPIEQLARRAPRLPEPSAVEAARMATAFVEDDALRAALARLGAYVLS